MSVRADHGELLRQQSLAFAWEGIATMKAFVETAIKGTLVVVGVVAAAVFAASIDEKEWEKIGASLERDAAEERFRKAANSGNVGDVIVEGMAYVKAEQRYTRAHA